MNTKKEIINIKILRHTILIFLLISIATLSTNYAIAQSNEIIIYTLPGELEKNNTPPTDEGCEKGRDDRSSDLCAQWKAADAASASVVWSERSFYLGVVGAFFGLLTLAAAVAAAMFARKAALEAERGSDAAAASVASTRELGEAQIRAYLFLKGARYECSRDSITITLEIGNSGQSPANGVRLVSQLFIQEIGGMPSHPRVLSWVRSDETSDEAQPVNSNSTIEEKIYFAWGFNIPDETEDRSKTHLKHVFRDGNSLSFDTVVHWQDVFGTSHKFQAFMGAEIGPSPTNKRTRRLNKGRLDITTRDTEHRVMENPNA